MATSLNTPIPSADPPAQPADCAPQVAELKKVCGEAFSYPAAARSCSHAVWYVISTLIDSTAPMRTANNLILHMTANWREVTLEEGWNLANRGDVVVGGKSEPDNGHVIVIYPGDKIPGGGYQYEAEDKISGGTKTFTMRSHGLFPRCLSRTMGSWPGGTSNGDKNVFDPWGKDSAFRLVRYWTPKKP